MKINVLKENRYVYHSGLLDLRIEEKLNSEGFWTSQNDRNRNKNAILVFIL
jgi:hypothetical protein